MSVRVTRLESGLTVVTDRMAGLKTASLGITVGSGSRNEDVDEHGISHLLEHMAFKGTRRRTARDIVEEIEAVGGDINAATSVETTSYYARMLEADVPLAVDILTDILSDPAFDSDELAREHNVIIQEIGAAEDTPDDLVFDLLQETAFPDQPVGRSILGRPETVSSFGAGRLAGYLQRQYRAPGMVVAAAGSVDHDALVDDVARRLSRFATGEAPHGPAAIYGGGTVIEPRDLEQAHLALAIEGLPNGDPDLYAAQIFTNLVGGGMSSRLFQQVREERGLCYAIHAFHWPYRDTGLFGLYAGTDPADAAELADVALDILTQAADDASDREVARARAQMKAGLLMALESSASRIEQLTRHIFVHGRPLEVDEMVARIDAVTVDQVRAVGRRLVAGARPAFAALGPGPGLETAAGIVERWGAGSGAPRPAGLPA
jgi:predicted Zn-dependent peptidase